MDEVEKRIRSFLLDYDPEPRFVIQPLVRVSVGGYVEEPSLYFFDPGVTLTQAVAMAGGAAEEGRKDRVILVRDGREHTIRLISRDANVLQMAVRSGDQLIVERRRNVIRDYLSPAASGVSAVGTLFGFLKLVGVL